MHMTIGKKLIFSFLSLALLVLLSGVVGVVVLKQSSGSADIVGKDKAPIQYAVMNAALTLERVQELLTRYTHANTGLPELEKDINANFAELNMWFNAIKFGTASKEFTSSPSGALFKEKQIDIVLRAGSTEIVAALENAMQLQTRWQVQVSGLWKEHTRHVGFNIVVGQKTYTLPEFLNMAQIHHLEWVKQLKDAVNIETTFTGGTEFEKDLVGEWLASYSIDSQEFMAIIGKMVAQQKKLFDLANKINENEKFADKLRTYNKGIVVISKIEKYFKEMQQTAAKTYQDLDATKQEKFTAATQSAKQINAQLTQLIKVADKEMQQALQSAESARRNGTIILVVLTIVAVAISLVLGGIISRFLARKILELADATKKISQGDLQKTLQVTSKDELGALAGDTNTMIGNLRKMIGQILTFSGNLTQSSALLAGIANNLDQEAKDLNSKSKETTRATEKMTGAMNDISSIANDSRERVHNVAQATEEMTATISEIAEKTEMARSVTAKAVITVDNTTEKMTELSEAANEISKVAEVIVSIADQTNLLSLNATIEAARAGDAGKGFAVVANEVKELAKQTNLATGDIRQKIEAIQRSSQTTISEITEISKIINDINLIVVVIAGAVEEQAVTTRQITEDISSVSGGIDRMSKTIDAAADIAFSVQRDIDSVNKTSDDVQGGSSQIKGKAGELDQLSRELQTLVARFRL